MGIKEKDWIPVSAGMESKDDAGALLAYLTEWARYRELSPRFRVDSEGDCGRQRFRVMVHESVNVEDGARLVTICEACLAGLERGKKQAGLSREKMQTEITVREFEPPLDPGIKPYVELLRSSGIETFESCQGGKGHAYPEPTVRFHGDRSEGFRALAVAIQQRWPVSDLRRTWPIVNGEPTGPWWEMTFYPSV